MRCTCDENELKDEVIALRAKVEDLTKQIRQCPTCEGSGLMEVLDHVEPPDCREVYVTETCAECHGTTISSWGQALDAAEKLAKRDSAINETLRLADFLNDAAERGAGFYLHWGERVMQTVEPLRNIEAFANQVLSHNRTLLETNGEFLRQRDEANRKLAAAKQENQRLVIAKEDLRGKGEKMITVGSIVNVYWEHIASEYSVKVLSMPQQPGDSWIFERSEDRSIIYVQQFAKIEWMKSKQS